MSYCKQLRFPKALHTNANLPTWNLDNHIASRGFCFALLFKSRHEKLQLPSGQNAFCSHCCVPLVFSFLQRFSGKERHVISSLTRRSSFDWQRRGWNDPDVGGNEELFVTSFTFNKSRNAYFSIFWQLQLYSYLIRVDVRICMQEIAIEK